MSHGLLNGVPVEDVEIHALYHSLLRAELRCPSLPIILRRQCYSPGRDMRTVFLVQIQRLQSQLQALHAEGEPPTADSLQNASVTR